MSEVSWGAWSFSQRSSTGGEGNNSPMCKLGVRVNLQHIYWNRKRDWSDAYQRNAKSRGSGAAAPGAKHLTENSWHWAWLWEIYPECPGRSDTHWSRTDQFQSLIVLSPLPLATVPSKPHATENTLRLWCDESAQEATSAKGKPQNWKKKKEKKSHRSECPLTVDWHSKVPAEPTDQTLIVLSLLPVASLVPSLFHATERTLPFSMRWFSTRSNSGRGRKLDEKKKSHQSECPLSVESHFPDLTFQIFTVLSELPLANEAPSFLHATDQTLRLQCHESEHKKKKKISPIWVPGQGRPKKNSWKK